MGGGLYPPPISSPPRASGAVSSVCLPQRSASTGMVRNYHIEPLAIERSGRSLMVTSQLRDGTKVCIRLPTPQRLGGEWTDTPSTRKPLRSTNQNAGPSALLVHDRWCFSMLSLP